MVGIGKATRRGRGIRQPRALRAEGTVGVVGERPVKAVEARSVLRGRHIGATAGWGRMEGIREIEPLDMGDP